MTEVNMTESYSANNGNGEKKFFDKIKNYIWLVTILVAFMFAISKYIIYTEPLFRPRTDNVNNEEYQKLKCTVTDMDKRLVRQEERYESFKSDLADLKSDSKDVKEMMRDLVKSLKR